MDILRRVLTRPRYDGLYLKNLVQVILGKTKLSQTLTNVVITAFDIKKMQPVIFSTYQVYRQFLINLQLYTMITFIFARNSYNN